MVRVVVATAEVDAVPAAEVDTTVSCLKLQIDKLSHFFAVLRLKLQSQRLRWSRRGTQRRQRELHAK